MYIKIPWAIFGGVERGLQEGVVGDIVEFYGISKMYPTLVAKENFRPKKKDVPIANGDVACKIVDVVIAVIHSFSVSKASLNYIKQVSLNQAHNFFSRHRIVKQIYQFLKMTFIFTKFILQVTWMHIFVEFGFGFLICQIIDTRDVVRLMY